MKYSGYFRATEIWHKEQSRSWPILAINEIELDQIEATREKLFLKLGKKPSYTSFVIKAFAIAVNELRPQYPTLNAYIREFLFFRSIFVFPEIGVGVTKAIEVDGQEVILPLVVRSPHEKTLIEITEQMQSLAKSSEHPDIKNILTYYRLPSFMQSFLTWLAGFSPGMRFQSRGSINVSTLGNFGIDLHTLPMSASLQIGMGMIRDRVVARDGKPYVTKTFNLSCAFNRRLISGKVAGILLNRVREILHNEEIQN